MRRADRYNCGGGGESDEFVGRLCLMSGEPKSNRTCCTPHTPTRKELESSVGVELSD